MEINWLVLGIFICCAIFLVAYLIVQNLKDKNETIKFFNEKFKTEKKFEVDDNEEV